MAGLLKSNKHEPAVWKNCRIEDLCTTASGGTPLTTRREYYEGGHIPWLRSGEVAQGRVRHAEISITQAGLDNSSAKLFKKGTILVAMYGATAGEVGILEFESATNQAVCGVTPGPSVDGEFLFQALLLRKSALIKMAGGGAQPNISQEIIRNFKIPLPPLDEQRKIAEILRTWDEAIEIAEAELKVKQERKRWLMDKLLRLGAAGFSKSSASGWTAQRLGDILEIRHGKNQREVENPEGRYPILGTGGIIGRTNAFLYDRPSVLIGRKGTIDRPQYMDTPFWTIDTLFYTSISDRALPRFIFYVFCTINWQQYNAATGVPSLAASTIESIKIQLPPLAEQREIADILQAVDADIEVINCRIESLRAQKRGLMQKLLTGEVRVAA